MSEWDAPPTGTSGEPGLGTPWEPGTPGGRPGRRAAARRRSVSSGVRSSSERWQDRGSGLAPHRAAALAYLAGPFTGALFLILDEDDPYVRFHALQSIALTIAWVALWIVVLVVAFLLDFLPLIGDMLAVFLRFLVAAISFGIWLYSMSQAYRGEEWEVPLLGLLVRRLDEVQGEADTR